MIILKIRLLNNVNYLKKYQIRKRIYHYFTPLHFHKMNLIKKKFNNYFMLILECKNTFQQIC